MMVIIWCEVFDYLCLWFFVIFVWNLVYFLIKFLIVCVLSIGVLLFLNIYGFGMVWFVDLEVLLFLFLKFFNFFLLFLL